MRVIARKSFERMGDRRMGDRSSLSFHSEGATNSKGEREAETPRIKKTQKRQKTKKVLSHKPRRGNARRSSAETKVLKLKPRAKTLKLKRGVGN
jgi:hypothetical protein